MLAQELTLLAKALMKSNSRVITKAPVRFLDEEVTFRSFTDSVDVVCPSCGKMGVLNRSDKSEREFTFRCSACIKVGTSREDSEADLYGFTNADPPRWQGYELFRVTRCRGRSLWALNLRHCAYLSAYIAAGLRERVMLRPMLVGRLLMIRGVNNGIHITSRLPRWMALKSAREDILRGLKKLTNMP